MNRRLVVLGWFLAATFAAVVTAALMSKTGEPPQKTVTSSPSEILALKRLCMEAGRRRAEEQDRMDKEHEAAMLPHSFVFTESRYCYSEERNTCLYRGSQRSTRSTASGIEDLGHHLWIEDLATNDTLADVGLLDEGRETKEAFARKERAIMGCLPADGAAFRWPRGGLNQEVPQPGPSTPPTRER